MKIFVPCINVSSNNLHIHNFRKQLCGAYCTIAELFMTDLCFETDAESRCEFNIQEAIKLDTMIMNDASRHKNMEPQHPDALQTLSSLRLSQNKGLEAVKYILDAYNRMKIGCEALADLAGFGKDENSDYQTGISNVENLPGNGMPKELDESLLRAAQTLPGFEFRCQSVKILLECADILQHTIESKEYDTDSKIDIYIKDRSSCVEAAIQVLGSLMAENDEVVEIWFLLGCAFKASTPPNLQASKYYWESSLNMLQKVKEGVEIDCTMEDELIDLNSKINEVEERLKSLELVKAEEVMDES
mmetsp:Transcript_15893/g.22644  ORF Transcript_15893/g.22644 Transcript_15893/m.22644 type:complete len:302 (+) Transcript_15893:827-1732(+)